ncbi:MAG: hypothetical protein GY946_33090, partial [bacterium]|nr:hypothetical protein [bacterium]
RGWRGQVRGRGVARGGRCGECSYLGLCRGARRERAITCHGDIWAPDPACLMTDEEIGFDPAGSPTAKELP